MHIITGLLISYLFNRNKGQKLPPLLQFYWPIQTKHLLPGRVRFAIPLLKDDYKNLKHAQTQIKKIRCKPLSHLYKATIIDPNTKK